MENTTYGKAALSKLAPVAENFRVFEAGWLGDKPSEWTVMEVKGMEFRAAKTGPRKGELVVPVPGTKRTVYVTRDEMRAFDPEWDERYRWVDRVTADEYLSNGERKRNAQRLFGKYYGTFWD